MNDWLSRNRVTLYVLLNVAVVLATLVGWSLSSASVGLVIYAELLFALCTLPLVWLKELNGSHALLAIFMTMYFLLFGAVDVRDLVTGADPSIPREGFFTLAQIGALLGACCILAGYKLAVQLGAPADRQSELTDWSTPTVLVIGVSFFVLGTLMIAYFTLVVATENTTRSTLQGFESMGPLLTFAVMLGQLVQPLGAVILAYGYAKSPSRFWGLLTTVVVAAQVLLGFLTDTKGTVVLALIIVAVTKSLWDGKVAKIWLLSILLFATIVFPILQANRIVRNERGWDRAQVVENFGTVIEAAIEQRDKVYETHGGVRSQTFLERTSGEVVLEMLFDKVTESGTYLNGATLVPIAYTFIPRLILPDKVDVAVGQLFNQTFNHGSKDDFLFLSVSILGEMYWNFGWVGVIVGNLLFGGLLGVVGVRTSLAKSRSLTRLLVLLLTVKVLCRGYEDSIALSVVTWLRCLAAIGLLHVAFSRPARAQETRAAGSTDDVVVPVSSAGVRFPNLLR